MKITTLILILLLALSFNGRSQNLYTQQNAANIQNEANATTGWTGPATIASVTGNAQNGTYSLRLTTTYAGRYSQYSFTAVVGIVYNISIWARKGTNNANTAFENWVGFQNFTTTQVTSTSWLEYTFTLTATSTNPQIRVTASQNGPSGRQGYIDAITITAVAADTQAPTAPTNLTASNTTTVATTLNWNASTDNVGVTQYQIRRNDVIVGTVGGNILTYNATGLGASTTYSFNVLALDTAGNISPPSNTVQVTTLSGNGGGAPYTDQNANLPTVNWQAQNLFVAGSMGIGTSANSNYRLSVNGIIRTPELVVESGWSDFVFKPDYKLPSLLETEQHIMEHGHLKDIPSAAHVQANGIGLAEINMRLMQKIEELTLYLIEAHKRLETLESKPIQSATLPEKFDPHSNPSY